MADRFGPQIIPGTDNIDARTGGPAHSGEPKGEDTPAWTIYKATGQMFTDAGAVKGPDTEQQWVDVVPASALAQALEERDRLRQRTHEIQEAETQRHAKLESEAAYYRNAFARAREHVKDVRADWTTDPPSQEDHGWWRYTSENTRNVAAMLLARAESAEQREQELRKALERIARITTHRINVSAAQCHEVARRALDSVTTEERA